MRNYEYILASVPVIKSDTRSGLDFESVLAEIRENLDGSDLEMFETLADGFTGEKLDRDFYLKALKSPNPFIRSYFSFDLDVRNAKVEFINKSLGRPEGTDILVLDEDSERYFEDRDRVDEILARKDLIERERGLDGLMWEKIDSMTGLEVFTLEAILAYTAKLQIVTRRLKLDPDTGKELFEKLVNEIRNNKKPIE